ncbi:hypothetical protein NDU88_000801 [Pleurodeles waltl]|uniref:Uncharacterized protein n=1 Tax=Pleurodeles waltl TaxID=8319 RepID=A0AAV7TGH3_PLEWA|nr:hypothetical protein NDU88_000801 [Pleurodeles waltl]
MEFPGPRKGFGRRGTVIGCRGRRWDWSTPGGTSADRDAVSKGAEPSWYRSRQDDAELVGVLNTMHDGNRRVAVEERSLETSACAVEKERSSEIGTCAVKESDPGSP